MTTWAPPAPEDLLCVDLDGGSGETWRECADLLRTRYPRPHSAAVLLARDLLSRYPGCLVTVVRRCEGGCAVGLRLRGPDRIAVLVLTAGRPVPRAAPVSGSSPCR
ncbi:hypothetical protein [Streptomyces sp. NPDC051909]|uniref:hypothetical protein n=1 Tax=Streptomyces sp. NPDC051909 TaxID=3154944 RepID=UPI00341F09BA